MVDARGWDLESSSFELDLGAVFVTFIFHHHCIILQGWVIRTLIGGLPDPRSPEDTSIGKLAPVGQFFVIIIHLGIIRHQHIYSHPEIIIHKLLGNI